MKRRIITIAVSFLLCIGMIGAGFAAWVITGNTEEEANGNIQVQEVVDNRLDLQFDWKDGNSTITYGPKAGSYTNSWLTYDSTDPVESLSVTLVLTLNNYESLSTSKTNGTINNISISFSWDDEKNTDYATARDTDKVVGALPTVASLTLDSFKDTDADGVYTAEVTFTFAWGEAFIPEGETVAVNPMEYYNNQEYTAELANAAKTNLTNLYKLNTKGYVLDLTGGVN